ncbi:MAG: beta-hydroxyacyl-ACP dehydratase [Phycisphaerales bacterium]|nr:MAG: beta-hydroxyacyl-ACP dehydratase [Phycisphaerales bacterium]
MTDAAILESIPHRPPFLFVDKIVEVSDKRILTRKLADTDADFFRGHYPGRPVMPGVLLCECCFQAGALLIARRIGADAATDGVPVVTRIQDARFRQMVSPGQMLDVEATLDEELDGAYFLTGRITVDGKLALRVSFACMLAKDKE